MPLQSVSARQPTQTWVVVLQTGVAAFAVQSEFRVQALLQFPESTSQVPSGGTQVLFVMLHCPHAPDG